MLFPFYDSVYLIEEYAKPPMEHISTHRRRQVDADDQQNPLTPGGRQQPGTFEAGATDRGISSSLHSSSSFEPCDHYPSIKPPGLVANHGPFKLTSLPPLDYISYAMPFQEQVSSSPVRRTMTVLSTIVCMIIDIRIMKDS